MINKQIDQFTSKDDKKNQKKNVKLCIHLNVKQQKEEYSPRKLSLLDQEDLFTVLILRSR